MTSRALAEENSKLENERNAVIRKNMREIRKQSGKTQEAVARGLLIDRTVYSKYGFYSAVFQIFQHPF